MQQNRPIRGRLHLAVLTSVETRHRFFANALSRALNVVAVVYARPSYVPALVGNSGLTEEERQIVDRHFAERIREEENFFGQDAQSIESRAKCRVLHLNPGELNMQQTVDFLLANEVDTVAVFGTDLIKPPLLSDRWCMINMHLGLSPYYRGTATNFYPLLNEEPAYVGATIHRLDAGVDSGAIFCHARPEITVEDQPHTIGCKAIVAGISTMITVLRLFEQGEHVEGIPQWHEPRGKVYYRRDYHPRQVVELYRKWNAGFLSRCLAAKREPPRLVSNPGIVEYVNERHEPAHSAAHWA